MLFPSLLGNESIKHAFASAHALDSGCIILSGPRGSGKRTAAFDIAMGLLCTQDPAPCGRCGACVRMKAGSHPDYEFFNPDGGEIKVDAVRELRARSFIRPSEAARKVFVINAADKMNVQSQNALLKVLEEPVSTVFILLCENSEALLQTVRSRSMHYRLEPLDPELLRDLLAQRFPQAGPDAVCQAIESSGGYLGPAIDILSGAQSEVDTLADSFASALRQDELSVFSCCMDASRLSRDDYAQFCDALCKRLAVLVRQGTSDSGFLLSLYEYVEKQKAQTAFNASVTALSGALAAFCGDNLKHSWRNT